MSSSRRVDHYGWGMPKLLPYKLRVFRDHPSSIWCPLMVCRRIFSDLRIVLGVRWWVNTMARFAVNITVKTSFFIVTRRSCPSNYEYPIGSHWCCAGRLFLLFVRFSYPCRYSNRLRVNTLGSVLVKSPWKRRFLCVYSAIVIRWLVRC